MLSGSCGGWGCCATKRKLPGHTRSVWSSDEKGAQAIPSLACASWKLGASTVPPLHGLCTSEWGCTPSDRRIVGVFTEKPIIAIDLCDWYLLAAPLSLLWAFWWPPNACELKNFLLQKLHEKTFAVAGLDCKSGSAAVESEVPPMFRFNHSLGLSCSLP